MNSDKEVNLGVKEEDTDTTRLLKNKEESEEEPKLVPSQVFGWTSFSVVWNTLNTVVYSAIYPKMLENSNPDNHTQLFATNNTITTIISALMLPIVGSIVDQKKAIKSTLAVSQMGGILLSYCFLFFPLMETKSQTVFGQTIYISALIFLRISVMTANSTLILFAKSKRTLLSLIANFVGFFVNLLCLLLLSFTPNLFPDGRVFTKELWWIMSFTSLSLVAASKCLLSFCCKN